jgi:glycosyltransferase involved in cell wall biosynthesis
MRILYFNYLWDIHGASIGSVVKPIELFAALEKRGHVVKMCWLKDQPDNNGQPGHNKKWRGYLKKYLAKFVHDPKLFMENFKYLKMEQEQVNSFKPDVLISRLDLYLFSALLTARKNHLPLIIEADCPPVYEATEFQKQYFRIKTIPNNIEKKVLKQADYAVMQSNSLLDYFIQTHELDPEKTAVASNAVNPEKFSNIPQNKNLKNRYNLHGSIVLGFVGSLSVWHGVDNLQKIIKNTVSKFPTAKFLIVGTGGGFENEMIQYLNENNLSEHVIFTGYVPHEEIPKHIALMDIALAPYPKLDFFYYSPVKIYEYMAAAKAIVSTDIGQIAEVITHKHDGYLCPPNDLSSMMDSIFFLLEKPTERKRIGGNAKKTVALNYSWDSIAQKWDHVLKKVVSEKQPQMNRL